MDRLTSSALCGILMLAGAAAARAEIVSFTGHTEARVQEYREGVAGDTDVATESFPDTDPNLPLQVVATLHPVQDFAPAAAAAAAQFADPTELAQQNPEEFAINLTLASRSEVIRYDATAITSERRTVLFTPQEIAGTKQGDTVTQIGRLFLDGALAVFAASSDANLTGAEVVFNVTVRRIAAEQQETVFSGSVTLRGSTGGDVNLSSEGSFPTGGLIFTNLAAVLPDFGAAGVLIIPGITIEYPFDAVIGEEFDLEAEIRVDASNTEGDTGVAAILGTPIDTLAQVINAVHGQSAAGKFIAALEQERDDPTGDPAFPRSAGTPLGLGGLLCPALGLTTLSALFALTLVQLRAPVRRRERKRA